MGKTWKDKKKWKDKQRTKENKRLLLKKERKSCARADKYYNDVVDTY